MNSNYTITNKQFNLPENWIMAKLVDVAEIFTGKTPSKKISEYYGKDIPFVKPPSLNDTIVNTAEEYLSKKGSSVVTLLPPLSVLVSCIGILGKTGINTIPIAINQQINAIVFSKIVNPKFGFFYTQTLKNWLYKNSSSTVLPIINKSRFQLAPIPIPPLNEQNRIVTKLEELLTKLDAGIGYLKKTQTLLKQYHQSILKNAFEGKLTEKWRKEHKNLSSKNLLEELINERRKIIENTLKRYKTPYQPILIENFTIPPEWCYISADQFTTRITDGEHLTPKRSSNGILLLSARNVLNNQLSLNEVDFIPQEEYDRIARRLIIKPGDVLLSCSGTVGRTCIAPPKLIFTIVRSVAILKPLKNTGKFMCFALQSPQLQNQIARRKTQTAQSNIFQDSIKKLVFPLPPLEEQEEIIRLLEKDFSIINSLESTILKNLRKARILHQRILELAFEGKLVHQEPNDEPAQILLERIKRERESTIPIKKEKSKITKRKSIDNDSKQMRLM